MPLWYTRRNKMDEFELILLKDAIKRGEKFTQSQVLDYLERLPDTDFMLFIDTFVLATNLMDNINNQPMKYHEIEIHNKIIKAYDKIYKTQY